MLAIFNHYDIIPLKSDSLLKLLLCVRRGDPIAIIHLLRRRDWFLLFGGLSRFIHLGYLGGLLGNLFGWGFEMCFVPGEEVSDLTFRFPCLSGSHNTLGKIRNRWRILNLFLYRWVVNFWFEGAFVFLFFIFFFLKIFRELPLWQPLLTQNFTSFLLAKTIDWVLGRLPLAMIRIYAWSKCAFSQLFLALLDFEFLLLLLL